MKAASRWEKAVDTIAATVTAPTADEVDRDARFPQETVDALRAERLLSLPVPAECGGPGASLAEVNHAIKVLGGADASVGLILTMHYSQIVILARHATTAAHRDFLREIHRDQLLIANVNSEIAIRGDERRSTCAVEPIDEVRFRLVKDTPVISYGEFADAYFVTARSSAASAENDQVIAIVRREDASIEPTGPWDAMGLRGSRSRPFHVEATGDLAMILDDFATIVAQSGLPVTNLMFAYYWLGMAERVAQVAHNFARKRFRGASEARTSAVPLLRLAELAANLDRFRGVVADATATYDAVIDTEDIQRLDVISQFQTLKVNGTQLLADIANQALGVCGVAGYVHTSPYSVARYLRDALGAGLMANVDSVHAQTGEMLLIRKTI